MSTILQAIDAILRNEFKLVGPICDYVIFYQHPEGAGKPLYVFLCELK